MAKASSCAHFPFWACTGFERATHLNQVSPHSKVVTCWTDKRGVLHTGSSLSCGLRESCSTGSQTPVIGTEAQRPHRLPTHSSAQSVNSSNESEDQGQPLTSSRLGQPRASPSVCCR